MVVTTTSVQQLCRSCGIPILGGILWVGERSYHPECVNVTDDGSVATIARLEAENRDLRAEIDAVSSAIGSPRFMDPPDGGDVSIAEQVRRMRAKLETVEAVSDDMVRHVLTKLDPTWEDDCTAKSRANQRRHMRKTIIAIMDAIRNLEPRHD